MEQGDSKALRALHGGVGCDLVSGTGAFNARLGYITSIYVREDSSGIASMVEVVKTQGATGVADKLISSGTGATGTRSYVGTNTLKAGELYKPDHPVKRITPSAGTFIVYYQYDI